MPKPDIRKLTVAAEKWATEVYEAMGREEVVMQLESLGIACYDDEDFLDDLVPAAVQSFEAEDLELDASLAASKAYGHCAYMAWLDVSEVFQDELDEDELEEELVRRKEFDDKNA